MSATWTREAVEALGPITDVPTTAAIFDVDKETVYAQIRRGEWTATRVLRLGRKIKIPVRDLLALLYAPEAETAAVSSGVPLEHSCANGLQMPRSDDPQSRSQCGCMADLSGEVRPLRRAT